MTTARAHLFTLAGALLSMLLGIASFAMVGRAQSVPASPASDPGLRARSAVIYVVRRGWHIDIGFPAEELTAPLKSLSGTFPGVRYLFFGFGDRRYLMAKHHGGPVLLEALWPGEGLILATALSASPAEAFGAAHVIELPLSMARSSAAQQFIGQSLGPASPGADHFDAYAPGPYAGSLYFRSRARYSAWHTCNTWAAEVLQKAGLPLRTAGVVFAGQVWKPARRLAAAE